MEYVILKKKNKIATVTLSRPERYNAFAGRMREEILEAIEDAGADPEIGVIVITGAGKAFCAGGDVQEIVSGTSQAVVRSRPSERYTMHKVLLAIMSSEKPFLAAVNGVAAGGGCNLALACDVIIASEKARFVQSFVRRGAFPDWGAIYFLPRLVGYARAAELLFTGDPIDAHEALAMGAVNHVVPAEELMKYTYELAGKIACNAPVPISLIKRGIKNFSRLTLDEALDFESFALGICKGTDDWAEGFKSFLEKREPVFKGK